MLLAGDMSGRATVSASGGPFHHFGHGVPVGKFQCHQFYGDELTRRRLQCDGDRYQWL